MTRKNLVILLSIPIIFIYSMVLISPYIEGDQEHYRKFYEAIQNTSLFDTFKLSVDYLGAYEPMSLIVLWLGSQMGIDKDIYISLLNVTLISLLVLFLIKNKTNPTLIILFITNFYLIVLMTGAERLKIAYIFLMVFSMVNTKERFILLALAAISHFQLIILLFSGFIGYLDTTIRRLQKNFSIKKDSLSLLTFSFIFMLVFIALFYDGLLSKSDAYFRSGFEFSDFLQIGILSVVALPIIKNKLRVTLVLFSTLPFIMVLGGSRVNMISFTLVIYFLILEKRQNTIPVYALMLYMSIKSIPFILNIYASGDGFTTQQ